MDFSLSGFDELFQKGVRAIWSISTTSTPFGDRQLAGGSTAIFGGRSFAAFASLAAERRR
jgi:hypothetical protein